MTIVEPETIDVNKDFIYSISNRGDLTPRDANEYFDDSSYEDTTFTQQNGNVDIRDDNDGEGKISAINEETGEINWDCPCLKSALAPPCGEFFRESFSCFVASKAEPKGSDCLEKFAAMQKCFQEHPEVYFRETDDNDKEENLIEDPNQIE